MKNAISAVVLAMLSLSVVTLAYVPPCYNACVSHQHPLSRPLTNRLLQSRSWRGRWKLLYLWRW
jgi:hypothetical protein